jgi:LmbE family N-acetylglucosaminyl deacetylase
MNRHVLLRRLSQGLFQSTLARMATPLGEEELRRPALVFAPHPDDETLGCGGTILQKRRAGAALRIVFMTDGAASHLRLSPREEMRETRRREALEAVSVLGLEPAHVSWLDFPDGQLGQWRAEAVRHVSALLQLHRPEQLFLPYARSEHSDHAATHSIVYEAAGRVGLPVTLLEYPVWSWRHWRATLRFLRELRTSVAVQDVLAQKRAALERHVSQMQRRNGDPAWEVLGDVDQGAFLACLFQDYEYYRRVDLRR